MGRVSGGILIVVAWCLLMAGGYVDLRAVTKRFHYDLNYGYPKWSATIKAVHNNWPDTWFPDVWGRLNP